MAHAIGSGSWTGSARYVDRGRLLATAGEDGVVRCWTTGGELVHAFDTHRLNSCRATVDGVLIAGFNGEDGRIVVWNAGSGQRIHELSGHPTAEPRHRTGANTSAVTFSSDGRLLASGGFDDHVRLWSTDDGAQLHDLEAGERAWSLALSPDDAFVAVGAAHGTVSVWSTSNWTRVDEARASGGAVTSVCFTEPGDLVSGGGRGELTRWRFDGRALRSRGAFLDPDGGGIEGLALSPDGRWVAAASRAGWMRVWNLDTADELTELRRDSFALDVAFSPDGASLVVAGPSPVIIVGLGAART